MARSNIIEFARSFQESFQRQQQIEIQRQREERFDRQLIANADFQQSQANTQRQQFEQREQRLAGQAEVSAGFRERQFGLAERRVELEEAQFGLSQQDLINLNPKLEFLGRASKAGVPTSIVEEIAPFIPDDATTEEAPIFFEVAEKLPFFKQAFLFGIGEGFGRRKGPNISKEDVAPAFKDFLQSTNFANRPLSEQAAILRSFEESLGINRKDAEGNITNAIARDQVEFDLQSEFFKDIIKAEGGKSLPSSALPSAFPLPQVGGDPNDISGLSDDELRRIVEGR